MQPSGFQSALGVPEEAAELLSRFGLSGAEILMLTLLTWFTVALIKKHTPLTGVWLLVATAACSGVWCALWYMPMIPKPVAGAVLVFIGASGGWQTFKDTVGKIKSNGTNPNGIEPPGEFNRGPSKPGGG